MADETTATGGSSPQPEADEARHHRTLIGIVKSDKMAKTVVVEITQRVLHRTYKKYVTKRQRYKAHDEKGQAHVGDKVQIVESRPLSRDKRWRVQKVLEVAR
jgi:small subunit ribosomal protein S17